jgi:peptidoglycan hydrolase-like protein with peptidoglycan-binding domain
MFGGGSSGSDQYSQRNSTAPSSYNTAPSSMAQSNQTVAPVSHGMVRRVQTALQQDNDYRGQVDGVWGPMTERGVRKWQQAHNLNASGEIDMATLQAMNIQADNQNSQANNNGQNNSDQANGGNAMNNDTQTNGGNAMNTGQNAQTNGGQNYNTAGTHQSGSNYSSTNGQSAATPYPTDQGNMNNNNTNGSTGNGAGTGTGTGGATHCSRPESSLG